MVGAWRALDALCPSWDTHEKILFVCLAELRVSLSFEELAKNSLRIQKPGTLTLD